MLQPHSPNGKTGASLLFAAVYSPCASMKIHDRTEREPNLFSGGKQTDKPLMIVGSPMNNKYTRPQPASPFPPFLQWRTNAAWSLHSTDCSLNGKKENKFWTRIHKMKRSRKKEIYALSKSFTWAFNRGLETQPGNSGQCLVKEHSTHVIQ